VAHVAFVDHSYHQRTRATIFLPEILERHGHAVDVFWDESWIGGKAVAWDRVASYDVVIMFQSYPSHDGPAFRTLHPNVTFVPMFDQFPLAPESCNSLAALWQPFRGSKVISFSAAVHVLATSFGIVSHPVRYYPKPLPTVPRATQGLHGFFWVRRESELGWKLVRTLVGSTRFDSFHLHLAGDPSFPRVSSPPVEDVATYSITTSTWFEHRSDFEAIVQRANVFFAPRLTEGIGQSFLEAMGRGQCVIAADNPTMNEYIIHGLNGLLYDPQRPAPLDFSDVPRLADEARRALVAGRQRWEAVEERLVDFILTPSPEIYRGMTHWPTKIRRAIHKHSPSPLTNLAGSMSRTMNAAVRRRSG
jgi:Glycosyl transferases group 1